MNSNTVKVLVVDDSALVRKILSDLLGKHPEIEVVGTAQDGTFVLSKIEQLKPDVITLDVEMRNKGGLETLPEIVRKYPIPVIMVSAHTDRGAESTLRALELGAFDFVAKPQAGGSSLDDIAESLTQKILIAARSRTRVGTIAPSLKPAPRIARPAPRAPVRSNGVDLIAIGASTGGTEAIKNVLENLPDGLPGIVIVQHMPPGFTRTFANRLDSLCPFRVAEGEDGALIQPGTAWVAPGGRHMEVTRNGGSWRIRLHDEAPVNRHRPSVDVLFNSVARHAQGRCIGVILTGMGGDGSQGLRELYDAGALTVAQDEASCVVFGMPKEAIRLGGAAYVLPLDQIASIITQAAQRRPIGVRSAVPAKPLAQR